MQARLIGCALAVVCLSSVSCKKGFGSGFEGEITMHVQGREKTSDMVVKVKDEHLRFDLEGPAATGYTIFDPTTNEVFMINDAQKSYFQLDFSAPTAPQANTNGASATIDKTGKHEKIAGVDCENWIAKDPTGKRTEVCIAQGLAFFDVGGARRGDATGLAKELREKKLFPLRSLEFDAAGKQISSMEVTKIESKKLADSDFKLPAGYSKVTLPGM